MRSANSIERSHVLKAKRSQTELRWVVNKGIWGSSLSPPDNGTIIVLNSDTSHKPRHRRPSQVTPTTPLTPLAIFTRSVQLLSLAAYNSSLFYTYSLSSLDLSKKKKVTSSFRISHVLFTLRVKPKQDSTSSSSSYIVELRLGYAVTPAKE